MAQDTKTQEPQTQQPKETSLQSVNFDEGLVPALQNGNLPQNPQRELPQTDGQTDGMAQFEPSYKIGYKIGAETMSNRHLVPMSKKTSDDKTEFTGPLTSDALQMDIIFTATSNGSLSDLEKAALDSQFFSLSGDYDRLVDRDSKRFLIQNEPGADGKMVPVKLIVGTLNDKNEIHVMSVNDMQKNEIYRVHANSSGSDIPSAIVIRLSEDGYLRQAAANDLAADTEKLEKLLNVSKPQSDGKTTVLAGTVDRGLDFRDASGQYSAFGLSLSEQQRNELRFQTNSFSHYMSITGEDGVSRVLLGGREITKSVDETTHRPVEKFIFTHSANVQEGKISPLETPIELPVTDGRTRREDIDAAVKQVQEAVQKKEISQLAPQKGTNPEFDAMIAKGPSGAVAQADDQAVVPSTPMVAGKAKGVTA